MNEDLQKRNELIVKGTCLLASSFNVIVLFIASVNIYKIFCVKKLNNLLVILFYAFAVLNTIANLGLLCFTILYPDSIADESTAVSVQMKITLVISVGVHLIQGLSFYWFSAAMQLVLQEITKKGLKIREMASLGIGTAFYTTAGVLMSLQSDYAMFTASYTAVTLVLMIAISAFSCFLKAKLVRLSLFDQFKAIIRSIYAQSYMLIGVYAVLVVYNCARVM